MKIKEAHEQILDAIKEELGDVSDIDEFAPDEILDFEVVFGCYKNLNKRNWLFLALTQEEPHRDTGKLLYTYALITVTKGAGDIVFYEPLLGEIYGNEYMYIDDEFTQADVDAAIENAKEILSEIYDDAKNCDDDDEEDEE